MIVAYQHSAWITGHWVDVVPDLQLPHLGRLTPVYCRSTLQRSYVVELYALYHSRIDKNLDIPQGCPHEAAMSPKELMVI